MQNTLADNIVIIDREEYKKTKSRLELLQEENERLKEQNENLQIKLERKNWREPYEAIFGNEPIADLPFPRFELICFPQDDGDWTDYTCGLYFCYQHYCNMSVLRVPFRITYIKGPDPEGIPQWYNPEQFDPIHSRQILHLKKMSGLPCYVRVGNNYRIEITDKDVNSIKIGLGKLQTQDEIDIPINPEFNIWKEKMLTMIDLSSDKSNYLELE